MNAVDTCPICGGSGWKITEREGISGAEKCECADVGREQRNEERANIPPLYREASVNNFILPSENPISRSALAKVLVMCAATCANILQCRSQVFYSWARRAQGKRIWPWRRCAA